MDEPPVEPEDPLDPEPLAPDDPEEPLDPLEPGEEPVLPEELPLITSMRCTCEPEKLART